MRFPKQFWAGQVPPLYRERFWVIISNHRKSYVSKHMIYLYIGSSIDQRYGKEFE